jgi:hypothetical protein
MFFFDLFHDGSDGASVVGLVHFGQFEGDENKLFW